MQTRMYDTFIGEIDKVIDLHKNRILDKEKKYFYEIENILGDKTLDYITTYDLLNSTVIKMPGFWIWNSPFKDDLKKVLKKHTKNNLIKDEAKFWKSVEIQYGRISERCENLKKSLQPEGIIEIIKMNAEQEKELAQLRSDFYALQKKYDLIVNENKRLEEELRISNADIEELIKMVGEAKGLLNQRKSRCRNSERERIINDQIANNAKYEAYLESTGQRETPHLANHHKNNLNKMEQVPHHKVQGSLLKPSQTSHGYINAQIRHPKDGILASQSLMSEKQSNPREMQIHVYKKGNNNLSPPRSEPPKLRNREDSGLHIEPRTEIVPVVYEEHQIHSRPRIAIVKEAKPVYEPIIEPKHLPVKYSEPLVFECPTRLGVQANAYSGSGNQFSLTANFNSSIIEQKPLGRDHSMNFHNNHGFGSKPF